MPSLLDQFERRGFRLVKNLATLGAALSESRPVDGELSEQITCLQTILPGEVPEWLIGPVSKTGVVARSPRVRIPPSPFGFRWQMAVLPLFSKGSLNDTTLSPCAFPCPSKSTEVCENRSESAKQDARFF